MKSKKILSIIVSFTIFSTIAPYSVFASTFSPNTNNKQIQTNLVRIQNKASKFNSTEFKNDIRILTKYVKRLSDGTFELDVPQSVKNQIDSDVLLQIENGMNRTNTLIKEGKLKSRDDLTVYDPSNTH